MRHGPHHGAQKSASTGTGLAATPSLKSAVEISTTQGRADPHVAQCGTPAATTLTRFFWPQRGQARTLLSLISFLI